MRLDEWLRSAASQLRGAGIESSLLEAQLLAAHLYRRDRAWILSHPEAEIPLEPADSLLYRRLAHEPLAYILGYREFYGRTFVVNPSVLVPRQDTETLVEAALEFSGGRVLDIGTGSGCLSITLQLERPLWKMVAVDISPLALEVARWNAKELHAEVSFVLGDNVSTFANRSFELIVSNPPYIGVSEELPKEVKQFEPDLALFAGGDGLAFYERLASEVVRVLKPNGSLLVEVGHLQSASVQHIFHLEGWQLCDVWKDLSGVERVLGFTR